MNLIELRSQQDHDDFHTDVAKEQLNYKKFWIGAVRDSHANVFRWVSDGSELTYANWATGQPDNQNDEENCVSNGVMEYIGNRGGPTTKSDNSWLDIDCNYMSLGTACS